MRRRSRFRVPAAALVAATIALLSLPAFAGWEEDYKKGKEAYEKGKPGEAIRLLRSAISQKNEEKANAIKASGMFFEPYLPHYYLGMALFQKKEYAAAVEELNKSERMGVVQKSRDLHVQLKQTKTAAETAAAAVQQPPPGQTPPAPPPAQVAQQQAAQPEPPPPEPAPPASPQAQAQAPSAAGTRPAEPAKAGPVTATPQTFTPPSRPAAPDPALQQAINAAASEIGRAEKLKVDSAAYLDDFEKKRIDDLVTGIRTAPNAAEANTKHQSLQRLVGDLTARTAERRRAEEEQAAAAAGRQALREAIDKAAPTLQEAESFAAANRTILEPAETQRLTSRVAAVRSAASSEGARGALRLLETDLAALKKSVADRAAQGGVRLAREQFARGVEAYYRGSYDEALSALQQAGRSLPREADLHAYIGSALYRKYLLARPADASLKNQAEQAFRQALAARAGYAIDEKDFPPKVVAFFKEVAGKR